MRMRRKSNLEPRLDKCSYLLIKNPEELRGKWSQTYGLDKIYLEIGCGKGRFITQTAQSTVNVLFIALEKTANVLVSALETTAQNDLKNLVFINAFADRLTEFFAPGEVSRIYINFCDPWPSNKHKKRRLVSDVYLRLYKEILCLDGKLFFKTDNLSLFEFALCQFDTCGFKQVQCIKNLHGKRPVGIMTEYEKKFYDLGHPIYLYSGKLSAQKELT